MDDESYEFPKGHIQVKSEEYTLPLSMKHYSKMMYTTPKIIDLTTHISDKKKEREKKRGNFQRKQSKESVTNKKITSTHSKKR